MLCLFVSVLTESSSNLRITLTVSLTSHCQILAYLGSLTHEVRTQTIVDNWIFLVLGYA